jgi:hypothetical protein
LVLLRQEDDHTNGFAATRGSGSASCFTNEVGMDGTIRFLRKVMGLWVLTGTLRTVRQAA